MTVKVLHYQALGDGPKLLILGAIHGNEKCGTQAIEYLSNLLDSGKIALKKGSLCAVPISNPRAYAEDKRFIDRNLNRHLYPKPHFNHYEDHLDPILCPLLTQADVLLDLHSYASEGGPFIFLGGVNSQETEYARALEVDHFIFGWQEAFGKAVGHTHEMYQADLESMGTTEFARAKGALAITLECGHHHNADAAQVGLMAALRSLQFFDMLRINSSETVKLGHDDRVFDLNLGTLETASTPANLKNQTCIRMRQVFYKEKPGKLAKAWQHFDAVHAGEALAVFDDGDRLLAEEDGYIVLPKSEVSLGGEWFYFGVKSTFPGCHG